MGSVKERQAEARQEKDSERAADLQALFGPPAVIVIGSDDQQVEYVARRIGLRELATLQHKHGSLGQLGDKLKDIGEAMDTPEGMERLAGAMEIVEDLLLESLKLAQPDCTRAEVEIIAQTLMMGEGGGEALSEVLQRIIPFGGTGQKTVRASVR